MIVNMKNLIKTFIELNNKLYKKIMKKCYDRESYDKAETYIKDLLLYYCEGEEDKFSGKKSVNNYESALMKLSLI